METTVKKYLRKDFKDLENEELLNGIQIKKKDSCMDGINALNQ